MPSLAHWAAEAPNARAIVSQAGTRTFQQLDAAANQVAHALRRQGLQPGDAVALLCGNRPEFAEVLYGCQRAGVRLTPINWHLSVDEIGYIVGDCEAKTLIAEGSKLIPTSDLFSHAGVVREGTWIIGDGSDGALDYHAVLARESETPIADPSPGTTMLYTSGTTGRPKGVHRTKEVSSGSINVGGYAEDGGDCHLCTGPLYHSAPLGFSLRLPLAYGATVVLMERWDAEDALQLIDEHSVTHTHMVPTMFHRLLALPTDLREKYDTSSLKYVLHGAAPCPVPVKRRIIEWFGPVIWEYYAATEGVGSFVDSKTWLKHPGTVGKPFGADQVIIGDADGNRLPPGETGLVYLKAPGKTRFSYYKDEEKTASTFRGDYFALGDVGYIDDDGYLFLTDRSANLIISGGVNIYPAEVDAALLEHPAVGDVATIGVPDEEWGESVLAVVELRDGWEPSDELSVALIDHCREHIAHFKCPRDVSFVEVLPRQDNGKIYKRLLRDQYRAR